MTSDLQVEHVTIFRNHLAHAGSTLDHPHSQVIGTPIVPPYISVRLAEAMHYYREFDQCLFCALLAQELEENRRIVAQSKYFVAFEPFASPSPFVTYICPRRHRASFGAINKEEIEDLAPMLKGILANLYFGLNDPDYCFAIRTAPKGHDEVAYFHWYISIVPQLNHSNSLERASVIPVNPIFPEDAAAFLNEVKLEKEHPSCLAV